MWLRHATVITAALALLGVAGAGLAADSDPFDSTHTW